MCVRARSTLPPLVKGLSTFGTRNPLYTAIRAGLATLAIKPASLWAGRRARQEKRGAARSSPEALCCPGVATAGKEGGLTVSAENFCAGTGSSSSGSRSHSGSSILVARGCGVRPQGARLPAPRSASLRLRAERRPGSAAAAAAAGGQGGQCPWQARVPIARSLGASLHGRGRGGFRGLRGGAAQAARFALRPRAAVIRGRSGQGGRPRAQGDSGPRGTLAPTPRRIWLCPRQSPCLRSAAAGG